MYKTRTIKHQITGSMRMTLDAKLETPDGSPTAYAIFSHCFTCTKDTLAAFRVSRLLAERGIAVMRFDFTGLGGSNGDFSQTNFSSNIADILQVTEYLSNEYQPPSLLIGHSLGGTAMLASATQIDSVKAVVTIASPSDPGHILHHFGPALEQLQRGENAHITVAGQHYEIAPQFIEDLKTHNMKTLLAGFDKPVLVFRVKHDALVDADNADEIKSWSAGEVKIVELEQANHILSDKADAEFVADTIIEWFQGLK